LECKRYVELFDVFDVSDVMSLTSYDLDDNVHPSKNGEPAVMDINS
jgi:hypothetical protein